MFCHHKVFLTQLKLSVPRNRFHKPKPVIVEFGMYLLNDDQEVNIQIGLTDDVGNPATLPSGSTVTWGSSDSTTVSVTVNATDQTQAVISSVGPIGSTKLGTAQVNVSVQLPNNPDGSVPPAITGQFDVQVVGSAPTSVSFNPGTPTQRTTS